MRADTTLTSNRMKSIKPIGGIIDMAISNYLAQLVQQFITLDLGLTSLALMNLPNSMLEPMNLYLSTFLYANYTNITNITTVFDQQVANGVYLPGLITPEHLKLVCHFNGTGSVLNAVIPTDVPVYKGSASPLSHLNVNSNNDITHYVEFSDGLLGTIWSNGIATGLAANVFDNDSSSRATVYSGAWYITYGFLGTTTKILKYFTIYTQGGSSQTITISGSNDNLTWDVLGVISGTVINTVVETTNTVAYKYYKISSPTSNNINIFTFKGHKVIPTPIETFGVVYDEVNHVHGTSSIATQNIGYLSGTSTTVNHLKLGDHDWHYRSYCRFNSILVTHTIFTILGLQLEIQATPTGLRVNYSTDGISFITVNSSAVSWNIEQWYFISVRRTGNTLYFFVDNNMYGTVDLTGVTLFSTTVNAFYIGADSSTLNILNGNIDEVEFFVGSSTGDAALIEPRTIPYIVSTVWQSNKCFVPTLIENVYICVLLDEVQFASFGVPIVNTDLNFYVSIDNGDVWNKIDLTKTGNLTTASFFYQGILPTKNLVNTNELIYKITNASGKVIKLDGVIIYWK